MEFLIRSGMQLFLINQEFLIIRNSSQHFLFFFPVSRALSAAELSLESMLEKLFLAVRRKWNLKIFRGAAPYPCWGAYSAPKPPAAFSLATLGRSRHLAQVLATMSLTNFSFFSSEIKSCIHVDLIILFSIKISLENAIRYTLSLWELLV